MANKVLFGIKNLHYSVITESSTGAFTYATPVAIPGAVSLTLDIAGDSSDFFADNVRYASFVNNNGYTGSVEVARFPQAFLVDVLGESLDTKNVLVENVNAEPKKVALLFQTEGNESAEKFVLYNVQMKRPGFSANTIAETKDPTTQSVDFVAMPSTDPAFMGAVKGRTTASTETSTSNAWFTTVHKPV